MKPFIIAAAVIAMTTPALAETHTVSWYEAHSAELKATMAECKDNPGIAQHSPNCQAAWEAQLANAAKEARAYADAGYVAMVAQQEQWWRTNPGMLLAELKLCNRIPAEQRAFEHCDRAFAVAQEVSRQRHGQ